MSTILNPPSAAVGGSDTQVQFNDAGALGGDAGLTYNKTTDALTVAGALTVATTISTPVLMAAPGLRQATADGADNGYVVLCGGGGESPARGALFYVLGNEFGAGQSGNVEFYMGNVAGSTFKVKNGSANDLIVVNGGTGITNFYGPVEISAGSTVANAVTIGSTHASGVFVQLTHNGSGMLGLGSQLIATGSGSASDMAFSLPGSLFLWSNAGGASAGFFPHQSDNHKLGRSGNRWKEVWASVGTIQTSDRRKKTDIRPSDCGLSFVNALQPVRYRWRDGIDDADRPHYGLIAQDLLELDGGAAFVHGNDTDGWGTNYSSFIAPLIAAVQELTRRLAALERE